MIVVRNIETNRVVATFPDTAEGRVLAMQLLSVGNNSDLFKIGV